MEQRKKYIIKKPDGGQISPEEMAMMEQQVAAQGQQGAPQQGGGQDEAMQQIMQMVEQMIQQGAQPADVAAELLGQQVPPEAIMQVFVEMGLPEQEAQAAIQQAMQAGPPAEGAPQGQPSPEEMAAMQQQAGQPPMMEHGGPPPHPEGRFTTPPSNTNGQVMDRTTNFVPSNTSFINEDSESLTYAFTGKDDGVQKGIIIPDSMTGKNINRKKLYKEALKNEEAGLETEGNVRFERDPAGNIIYSPGIEEEVDTRTVEQQLTDAGGFEMPMRNMKAGGDMFRKLMKKAWGGNLTKPGASSEDYVSDRAAMFVNAIKQNTAMSTLNESMKGDPFAKAGLPSKSLGGLPKFEGPDGSSDVNSETAGDNDLGFTDKQMEYIKNLTSGLNKVQQGIRNPNLQYQGFSGYNPYMSNQTVGYRDPRQFTRMDEIQRGMNPWARFLAGTGRTFSNPTIRGNNLPGGMSGAEFLSQMKGMSGVGPDGTPYRVSSGERYVEKDGTFLKNLNPFVRRQPTRRGIRYNIDYGTGLTDGTVNPEGATPSPVADPEVLDRRGMMQDMSRREKRDFRKLQRGRDGVSENDAYQRILDTRGGTEDPAQTGVNEPEAVFDSTDPDDMDLDNNAGLNEPPRARDMSGVPADIRAEMDAQAIQNEQRAAAAAAGDAMGVDEAEEMNNASIERMPLADDAVDPNLPVSSKQTRKNQKEQAKQQERDSFSEFGKRTTRQLQRKGVLDAQGNVISLPEEQTMPPTVEEMQANADRAQREQDQIAAMEQGVVDQENRQQVRELFDAQNPIASSDPNRVKGRTDTLKNVVMGMDPALHARGVVKDVPVVTDVTPSVTTEEVDEMEFMSPASDRFKGMGQPPFQPNMMAADGMTYGGGVSPQALANAVNLINMAFGGQAYSIPQATYGNMGMRMSNDSANVFSPEQIEAMKKMEAANSGTGTVDVAQEQGFEFAAQPFGQGTINTAKVVNFLDARGEMNRAQEENAERDQNAINTPDSYALSQVGLDNQFGQRFNRNFNNQVLNPTSNVGFGYGGGEYPFPQTMEYGGQYYEIGGDVDLTPEKLAEFEAAGFVLTRK